MRRLALLCVLAALSLTSCPAPGDPGYNLTTRAAPGAALGAAVGGIANGSRGARSGALIGGLLGLSTTPRNRNKEPFYRPRSVPSRHLQYQHR